jgi:hypothetical protein
MRNLVISALAISSLFVGAGQSMGAVVVKDCDEATSVNLETGLKFYQENWDELEGILSQYGAETAACMRNLVKNSQGTVICDISDCPMPGFKGWVIPPTPEANLCPWYVNEKMGELSRNADRAACLSSTAIKLFAMTCQPFGEEGRPFDTAAFNFYKSKNRAIRINSMECGHNSLKSEYFFGN